MIKRMMMMAVAVLAVCGVSARTTAVYDIVPLPKKVEAQPRLGMFNLDTKTVITYPVGNKELAHNANMLHDYLLDITGLDLKITDKPVSKNAIMLADNLKNDNAEAYSLSVTPKLITINGASAAGNYYGIQTLRKSIPGKVSAPVSFPAVRITDSPRFGYRGAHFDVVRHFFPVDSVKSFIEMAALHNVNRVHLHLTDDQGWRIEIKKHPRLTEVGSIRKGTAPGTDLSRHDSIPYGGYFTQDELRDIVKYAADRYITVIPEIDLPGHMLGALTAYPELGCTGGPYEVWWRWGISKEVLCAGNDQTYKLIEDVLDEVVDIFPSEFIHIGGDECPKDRWKECPKCQAKIAELGLKDDEHSTAEQKLQSHVMDFAAEVLKRHGRRAIGWDEILAGGAQAPTAIMSWRGIEGARKAVKSGLDAILTPTKYCYFDYLQADPTDEFKLTYQTYLPIDTVYSFEPVPAGLTPEEASHILGAQANLWCEYIPTLSYAQYKELPRLAAMCEVQWTDPEQKDFADFRRRLDQLARHYDAQGYNYAKFIFK